MYSPTTSDEELYHLSPNDVYSNESDEDASIDPWDENDYNELEDPVENLANGSFPYTVSLDGPDDAPYLVRRSIEDMDIIAVHNTTFNANSVIRIDVSSSSAAAAAASATASAPASALPEPISTTSASLSHSQGEERGLKRKNTPSPNEIVEVATSSAANNLNESTSDDQEICSICFEVFTNNGNHHACCLKCGHIFGFSCIQRWLRSGRGRCPQCNATSKRSEIRVLYFRNVKVIDTSEKERALLDLEKERHLRKKAELEINQFKIQLDVYRCKYEKLKKEIDTLSFKDSADQILDHNPSESSLYRLMSASEITKEGSCRILAFCRPLNLVIASHSKASSLFPSFGVRKMNATDFKCGEFIGLHSKILRDLSFSSIQEDGILLSASLDKFVRLTSMHSNNTVHKFLCDAPVYSCKWSAKNAHFFHAGLSNGTVLTYDVRVIDRPVNKFVSRLSSTPIISLEGIDYESDSCQCSGILVAQMDKISFLQNSSNGEAFHQHAFSLEGNFTSLTYEPITNHFLVSQRPSSAERSCKHHLCTLTASPSSLSVPHFSCSILHSFYGGSTQTLMSKSHIFSTRYHHDSQSKLTVCAADESSKSLLLWDAQLCVLLQRHFNPRPILDILTLNDYPHRLLALSDTSLNVYRPV